MSPPRNTEPSDDADEDVDVLAPPDRVVLPLWPDDPPPEDRHARGFPA